VKTANAKSALLSIAAGIVAVTLHSGVPGAQEGGTVLSAQALREIAQLEAEIDRVEAQTIERLATRPDNQVQQLELLGKLMPGAARQHSARHHRRFARGHLQFNRATIAGLALEGLATAAHEILEASDRTTMDVVRIRIIDAGGRAIAD
jgi:hypothetical protein